jgi:hypothetical protein
VLGYEINLVIFSVWNYSKHSQFGGEVAAPKAQNTSSPFSFDECGQKNYGFSFFYLLKF